MDVLFPRLQDVIRGCPEVHGCTSIPPPRDFKINPQNNTTKMGCENSSFLLYISGYPAGMLCAITKRKKKL
jgi:hypothetical protein